MLKNASRRTHLCDLCEIRPHVAGMIFAWGAAALCGPCLDMERKHNPGAPVVDAQGNPYQPDFQPVSEEKQP